MTQPALPQEPGPEMDQDALWDGRADQAIDPDPFMVARGVNLRELA